MPLLSPAPETDATVVQLDMMLALFRPWLKTEEAGFLLDDACERHIRDLLDEGTLRGVNIAVDPEGRRETRIYRYSVEHRIICPRRKLTIVPVEAIIPHHRPTVLRRELASWLACSEAHISNLALDGPRDSHDSRHRIYRDAAVKFLTERSV